MTIKREVTKQRRMDFFSEKRPYFMMTLEGEITNKKLLTFLSDEKMCVRKMSRYIGDLKWCFTLLSYGEIGEPMFRFIVTRPVVRRGDKERLVEENCNYTVGVITSYKCYTGHTQPDEDLLRGMYQVRVRTPYSWNNPVDAHVNFHGLMDILTSPSRFMREYKRLIAEAGV